MGRRRRTHGVTRTLAAGAVLAVVLAGCGSGAEPDPLRGKQWALNALRLPEAWKTSEGRGVTIAIVDTGVDLHHPDLKGHLVAGHDFIDDDADPEDQNGHGTHVAGIAAAVTDNGVGIAGGAPDAKIMPVRVLSKVGSGDPNTIAAAIVWAARHGAEVINLSLGESGEMARLLRGGVLNPAINIAVQNGAVVVAAAGNDGALKQPYKVSTPVLVVNATDRNGRPAPFTNFGSVGAVSAPGADILSTLPTYKTPANKGDTSGYGSEDGTSMATPYVSAVAALLRAHGDTVRQTVDAIRATARNPAHNPLLGNGIVDAEAAVTAKPR
ncbi:MAG TPA: S8 family serine peptidase [Streptosporangiaceae bacterium]|jgi:subtilisin family serine protease